MRNYSAKNAATITGDQRKTDTKWCPLDAAPEVPVVEAAVLVAGGCVDEVVEGRTRFPVAFEVGMAPPLAILAVAAAADIDVGLGMFDGLLYIDALAGVVIFVVVLR